MDFAVILGLAVAGLVVVGLVVSALLLGTLFTFLSQISDAYDDE